MNPIYRNIYLLGRAMGFKGFPLTQNHIERAIENTVRPKLIVETLRALQLGCKFEEFN